MREFRALHFNQRFQHSQLVLGEAHGSGNPIIDNTIQFFIIERRQSGFGILKGLPGFSAFTVLHNEFPDRAFAGPRWANKVNDADFLQFMCGIDLAIAHDFFCLMHANSTCQQAHASGAGEQAEENFRETEFCMFFCDNIIR